MGFLTMFLDGLFGWAGWTAAEKALGPLVNGSAAPSAQAPKSNRALGLALGAGAAFVAWKLIKKKARRR